MSQNIKAIDNLAFASAIIFGTVVTISSMATTSSVGSVLDKRNQKNSNWTVSQCYNEDLVINRHVLLLSCRKKSPSGKWKQSQGNKLQNNNRALSID